MLSTFKEDGKTMASTSDYTQYLPIGFSVTSPLQPATNTGLKGVLKILGAHVSRNGDVTYQVKSETIPL